MDKQGESQACMHLATIGPYQQPEPDMQAHPVSMPGRHTWRIIHVAGSQEAANANKHEANHFTRDTNKNATVATIDSRHTQGALQLQRHGITLRI